VQLWNVYASSRKPLKMWCAIGGEFGSPIIQGVVGVDRCLSVSISASTSSSSRIGDLPLYFLCLTLTRALKLQETQ
jgi:hypothetical protein